MTNRKCTHVARCFSDLSPALRAFLPLPLWLLLLLQGMEVITKNILCPEIGGQAYAQQLGIPGLWGFCLCAGAVETLTAPFPQQQQLEA